MKVFCERAIIHSKNEAEFVVSDQQTKFTFDDFLENLKKNLNNSCTMYFIFNNLELKDKYIKLLNNNHCININFNPDCLRTKIEKKYVVICDFII